MATFGKHEYAPFTTNAQINDCVRKENLTEFDIARRGRQFYVIPKKRAATPIVRRVGKGDVCKP